MYAEMFQRLWLVAGDEMMDRLRHCRVVIFGLGGVGSWAAEALVRSGIGHLTIVDNDVVAISNINRQLPATLATLGRSKVEVLAERFRQINPDIDLRAVADVYSPDTADIWDFNQFDYVIDAIDTLQCKALLIERATASTARLISSMGAARKLHADRIAVAEFWKVQGCPLARALRQHFKRTGSRPARKFRCIYSPETLPNRGQLPADSAADPALREGAPNGTFAHTTAIFGLRIAGLLLEDLYA